METYLYHFKVKFVTSYKTKQLTAEWDGDDRIEIYKKNDNTSVMTIDMNTKIITYYQTKNSMRPNLKGCLIIDTVSGEIYKKFKIQKVNY